MKNTLGVSWIEPVNFGPFAVPSKLYLDSRVTVLTGPNDVGKSSLLSAIDYCFSGRTVTEAQVNQERRDTFAGKWIDDPEVYCNFGLRVTDDAMNQAVIAGNLHPDDEVIAFRRINRTENYNVREVKRGADSTSTRVDLRKLPQSIYLNPGEVRNLLPLAELNETELKFLRLGFGDAFPKNLEGGRSERNTRVIRAQEALNQKLREILPPSLRLEFRISDIGGTGKELDLTLVDPLKSFIPLGSRGAGVRKFMSLMGTLLPLGKPGTPTLLLMDEPENSLHADAQHALRRLLERLAESPLLQVVYATHSPSMINTMRPASLRVLERREVAGKPTTFINNEAFEKNFVRVRSSLGLTPADSLLYAPVTIVVEGASEVRSLPVAYERLHTENVAGFEDVEDVLSQVHFLDGTGDAYEYMVRLAKSQNAKPILFLDGDKAASVKKVREQHSEVPIQLLDEGEEFESLVPLETYIGAVAKIYKETTGITVEAYEAWLKGNALKSTIMISKRVQRWLEDDFGIEPKKPLIMEQAMRDVDIRKLKVAPLKVLLQTTRDLLKSTQPI